MTSKFVECAPKILLKLKGTKLCPQIVLEPVDFPKKCSEGDDEANMKATGFWQLEGERPKQQGDGATLPAQ